ncbi:MAG: 5'-nucleotidase C-terminal domain-containing protein [Bacteroidales bacterium]|nr:5'-nucleotidase C-terminal domain-containing protein [Bacteroidales bacterium]
MWADILCESLGVDVMLMGSGALRLDKLGPIVTYADLLACYPYDESIYQFSLTGRQFKQMMRHVLRDEMWQGEHCEFYQMSRGVEIHYSCREHEFKRFDFNGEPLKDDETLTRAFAKYHFLNFEEFTSLRLSDVERISKPRVISISCFQIIEEYLSTHQLLTADIEGRIVVEK